jgi:hypothetical protein
LYGFVKKIKAHIETLQTQNRSAYMQYDEGSKTSSLTKHLGFSELEKATYIDMGKVGFQGPWLSTSKG